MTISERSLAMEVANNPSLLDNLDETIAQELLNDWDFWARPKQKMPDLNLWTIWLILAGRGWGKTLTGAQTVNHLVKQNLIGDIALVAPTAADARDVMVDELHRNSGILAVSPSDFMPKYEKSNRRVVWPNGAVATIFSAEDPDQLRGPQHDFAWCDELAAWPRLNIDLAWSNLMFGLRRGLSKAIVTTTPKPLKLLRELMERPRTYTVRASTYENIHNLSETFIDENIKPYEGTRLGRQELEAEILDDNPDALWTLDMIDLARVHEAPDMSEIVIGVDPAGSSTSGHEIGIIAAGRGLFDKNGYVLGDYSLHGTPLQWATRAIEAYDIHEADSIVVEKNYGGEMVASNIRLTAQIMNHPPISIREVHATRGKVIRAEPISGIAEQYRIHHVGALKILENQLCEFTLGTANDRVDAYVWVFTHLLAHMIPRVQSSNPEAIQDYLKEQSRRPNPVTTQMGSLWRKQF